MNMLPSRRGPSRGPEEAYDSSEYDGAFVASRWTNTVGIIIENLGGGLQLAVMTIGALGVALADWFLGGHIIGEYLIHPATFGPIVVGGHVIGVVFSAMLSAFKLYGWEFFLTKKYHDPDERSRRWILGIVMVLASLGDIYFNIQFAAYSHTGVVPTGLLLPHPTPQDYVVAAMFGLVTTFDAPALVAFVHTLNRGRTQGRRSTSAQLPGDTSNSGTAHGDGR